MVGLQNLNFKSTKKQRKRLGQISINTETERRTWFLSKNKAALGVKTLNFVWFLVILPPSVFYRFLSLLQPIFSKFVFKNLAVSFEQ
jgi:hypothetical protein